MTTWLRFPPVQHSPGNMPGIHSTSCGGFLTPARQEVPRGRRTPAAIGEVAHTSMLSIDATTARRFVLGKQGLWPGRRFRGLAGTEQAMRAMEYLQLDPLQVVARSHDIALYSRVIDYQPGMWEIPTYRQRRFFDWGGWLATRPMEELPHWRVVIRREREGGPDVETRVFRIGQEHAAAVEEMRQVLRERGTVSNRDFAMASRTRTNSYRGRKDSALTLYYLWRTGEAMTHHRVNFERVYALTEAVAPPELVYESPEDEADRFLIKKEIAFHGLARLGRTDYVWEVYKPEHQRRYGYYALPVLWGDRLVARFDSRLDRQARRLVLHGLWLEEETLAADEAFVEALAAGFQRFLRFLGAETLDAGAITESRLRARLGALKNG